MKKYEVNYNRSFPDHRLDYDYKAYQQIRFSPLQLFKSWKAGLFYTSVRYLGVNLSVAATFLYGAYGMYRTWDISNQDVMYNTNNRTSLKWGVFSEKGYGRFDVVHNRFENQPGGIRDWAQN